MANITKRITGRFGQIWMQYSSTAFTGDTATGNATAETVDDITYDAYQVWTLATAANIPMDPSTPPGMTVGGSGLPAYYTYVVNYLRGKIIFTPSLGASATLTAITGGIPRMYAMGHSSDFSLDVKYDSADASAQMETWKTPLRTFSEWSGTATLYYTSAYWWTNAAESLSVNPQVYRFYPGKTIGTEYWLGAAFITWGLKVPKGGVVEQTVSFQGSGPLVYKAS